MGIFLPRRWNKQPTYPVELASTGLGAKALFVYSPFLRNAWLAARPSHFGLFTGTAPTGNPYNAKHKGVTGDFHPGGGSNGIAGINTQVTSGEDVTMFWAGYPTTTFAGNLQAINRGDGGDSMRLKANREAVIIQNPPLGINVYLTSKTVVIGQYEQKAFTKKGNTFDHYDWRTQQRATVTSGTGIFRSDGVGDYFYVNHGNTAPGGAHDILIAAAFEYLTEGEVLALFENPWQVYRRNPQRIFTFPEAAGGTDINAALVSKTLAVFNPSISAGREIDAGLVSKSLTVFNPDVSVGTGIDAALVSKTLAVFNATIDAPVDVDISVGLVSKTLAVFNPDVSAGLEIDAALVTKSLTVFNAVVSSGTEISAGLISKSLTVFNPDVSAGIDIDAALVSKSLAVFNATVDTTLVVNIDAALVSKSLVVFNPDVSAGTEIDAALVSKSLTVFNATVDTTLVVEIDVALVSKGLTVFDPDVSAGIEIDAALATKALTVFNAAVDHPIGTFVDASLVSKTLAVFNPTVVGTSASQWGDDFPSRDFYWPYWMGVGNVRAAEEQAKERAYRIRKEIGGVPDAVKPVIERVAKKHAAKKSDDVRHIQESYDAVQKAGLEWEERFSQQASALRDEFTAARKSRLEAKQRKRTATKKQTAEWKDAAREELQRREAASAEAIRVAKIQRNRRIAAALLLLAA